jgi:hypothetical protein
LDLSHSLDRRRFLIFSFIAVWLLWRRFLPRLAQWLIDHSKLGFEHIVIHRFLNLTSNQNKFTMDVKGSRALS